RRPPTVPQRRGARQPLSPWRDPRARALGACLVGLCAFLAYLATVAPTITWQFSGVDSGDLASAVATWGIPHPTGFPLYVLLGGVVTHLLPFGQPAFRLNLFSAACSAAAAGLVFLTVLRLAVRSALPEPARWIVAAGAALALAWSRTLWSQSVLAEVYALEMLFAALLSFMLAEPEPTPASLPALAFVAGLSLTDHLTIIFSIAAGALLLALRFRGRLLQPRLLLRAGAAFVLPLALYLLLPWRASQHPASDWNDPTTLSRFWDVVTATQYHRLLDWSPVDLFVAVPAIARSLIGQWMPWVLPLAVLGATVWWRRDRPYTVYLIVLTVLASAFVALYRAHGRERYLLQAVLAITLLAALALLAALEWLSARLAARHRDRFLLLAAGAACAATVLPALIVGLGDFNLRDDWSAWNYAVNTLDAAPRSAFLLTYTDEQTFPLWYAQRAAGVRPDVLVQPQSWHDPVHQR
ncbi:MAG TPA: DUF2723 domain-containing protein, partial [Dehalococcoidia bacterium]|nr:DUF2723 domain-containing protein [Dehalococcoidia bacterium]